MRLWNGELSTMSKNVALLSLKIYYSNHSLTNSFYELLGVWTELIIKRKRFTVPLLIGYKNCTPRTKSLIDVMDSRYKIFFPSQTGPALCKNRLITAVERWRHKEHPRKCPFVLGTVSYTPTFMTKMSCYVSKKKPPMSEWLCYLTQISWVFFPRTKKYAIICISLVTEYIYFLRFHLSA